MVKIALFVGSMRSTTSLLIKFATGCQYTHAAIKINGTWYHSSEKLGCFGELADKEFDDRHATIFEIDADLSDWLESMKGKRYGWRGIFGWVLYFLQIKTKNIKGHHKHFYCFMAVLDALVNAWKHHRISNSPISLNKKLGNYDFLISEDLMLPIDGCDIAKLFPTGVSGLFKSIK